MPSPLLVVAGSGAYVVEGGRSDVSLRMPAVRSCMVLRCGATCNCKRICAIHMIRQTVKATRIFLTRPPLCLLVESLRHRQGDTLRGSQYSGSGCEATGGVVEWVVFQAEGLCSDGRVGALLQRVCVYCCIAPGNGAAGRPGCVEFDSCSVEESGHVERE